MSLENEKELVWGILRADPEYIAHHYAQELLELSRRRGQRLFHRRCDELLTMVMNTVQNPVYVLAIIKCWLNNYRLPIDPGKLPSFDRFHDKYGKLILKVGFKNIPVL
jgi:hypothetical protein